MISTDRLFASLIGDWVAFDEHGDPVTIDIPRDIGPAALIVSDVTEALKLVDDSDRIGGSVDRSRMWAVDAIVLNRVVLARLDAAEHTVEDLLEAVRAAGYTWQISPTSAP